MQPVKCGRRPSDIDTCDIGTLTARFQLKHNITRNGASLNPLRSPSKPRLSNYHPHTESASLSPARPLSLGTPPRARSSSSEKKNPPIPTTGLPAQRMPRVRKRIMFESTVRVSSSKSFARDLRQRLTPDFFGLCFGNVLFFSVSNMF